MSNMPPHEPSDQSPQWTFFEVPAEPASAADKPEGPPSKPRIQQAQRDQMEWLPMVLDI